MKFRSDEDGFITALRFYKQPNNTGAHVGHLWTSRGQQLAEVEFTNETASGWQVEPLPSRSRSPRTRPTSRRTTPPTAASPSTRATSGRPAGSAAPRRAPAAGGNGVYRYGAAAVPGLDLQLDQLLGRRDLRAHRPPDTRAPRSAPRPAAGARACPSAQGHRTFDEPVDPLTVNNGSFVLKDEAGTPVPATPPTTPRRARPRSRRPRRSSTARPTRRRSRAARPASPTSRATGPARTSRGASARPPVPLHDLRGDRRPASPAMRDQPLEVGVPFRAVRTASSPRCGSTSSRTTSARMSAHLWSGDGQLLATATYANETASGWQQAELPNPVAVTKDTTYVSSYHSPCGFFAFDRACFSGGAPPADGRAAPATVATASSATAPCVPRPVYNATNYWVDATFARVIPPDTRGPSVTETAPTAAHRRPRDDRGQRDVRRAADRRLGDAAHSRCATRGRGRALHGQLRRADPDGRLVPTARSPTTAYTATLKGGAGGVADAAGNPLRRGHLEVHGRRPVPGRRPGRPDPRRHRRTTSSRPTTRRSCARGPERLRPCQAR